jgi:hypothetical protein
MKKITLTALSFCLFGVVNAQDNVGIGTLTPNAKSVLDLTSNNKGFLAPRMATNERIAIAPAATEEALMVFDTDLKVYFYWDGTQWVQVPGNDADSDPTNELITNVVFNTNGNILVIEEGGNTWSTTIGIDINDADSDPTNELNTAFTFDNQTGILTITDAGGSITANLGGLNNDWTLTGNAGTDVATNYIGTSDNAGLSIRTNATERVRITAAGLVGIGTVPGYPLDVLGQTRITRNGTSLGVANESQLELFNGTTGDVFISFHKVGIWGAHFGLDATNWFSTTGWSAGTGFTSMRVGNIQANGGAQVTNLGGTGNAPVFADAAGNLFRSSGGGLGAPVQIYSFTFPTQSNSDPVPVQEFSTGIPVANYDCVLADYSTAYDIREQSRQRRKSWLYNNGGTWFWSVDYGVHSNNNPNITNTDVKVLCFSTSTSNWNGNPRERNINY